MVSIYSFRNLFYNIDYFKRLFQTIRKSLKINMSGEKHMKINDTFEGDKVPRLTKWLYPASTIARDASYTLVSLFFLTFVQFCAPLGYATEAIGVKDPQLYTYQMLVISALIILGRIWDGFNDPIMGWIVEKVHFRMGKYKPWILIGGLSNAVVLFCMFYFTPTGWWYVLTFVVFYLLWDFTFTMNDIGYWSMLPSLSSDEKERNQLTTLVSVCASIGAFAAGGVIPMVASGNAKNSYAIVAAVIAILFAASQSILFFFCKEHARDPKQEAVSEETKFTDMFRLVKTNSQLRVATIVILIYYLGSSLLNGFGLNFFYFTYSYAKGGSIQFIFTIAYAAGTIIAQLLFPLFIKKFTRDQLFKISFIVLAVGYVVFFFYDLPFGSSHLVWLKTSWLGSIGDIVLLSLLGVTIFAGQGVFYLILLVMMTNTIEYNEWKDKQRRESLIFALRPLTAKISSAIQAGVVALTLLVTGLYGVSSNINDIEVQRGNGFEQFASNAVIEQGFIDANNLTVTKVGELSSEQVTLYAQYLADKSVANINWGQLFGLKIAMTMIPLALFIVSYILIRKKYFLNEKRYQQMVLETEARSKPDYDPNVIVGDVTIHNELAAYAAKEKTCKKPTPKA